MKQNTFKTERRIIMDSFTRSMACAKARSDLEKAYKDQESFEMLQKMLFASYQNKDLTVDELIDRMHEIDKKIMDNKEMLYKNLKVIDNITKEMEKES
jgi:hypothetical protein